MSKGRHQRRPNGHPARATARRRHRSGRSSAPDVSPSAIARHMVREVEGLSGPLEAEIWASHMLGAMWEQRAGLPLEETEEWALVYGEPLVEALAGIGGPGARVALRALAMVDDGSLGGLAGALADGLPETPAVPSWLPCLGETTVTAAAVMREDVFDDGVTIFLEARHATGDTHAVGVYIDHNLGGMAQDILLAESISRVAEIISERDAAEEEKLTVEPVSPAVAASRIRAAMEVTELTLDAPVSEEYPALRALALLRSDEVPGVIPAPAQPGMTMAERDALRDAFLSAPEGRGFDPEGDEAFAVSLAIDFCVDYVDGRPLRWSPVAVELFLTDWVPRKVLAEPELLAALPAALDAWVRFAGRRRAVPEWATTATQEAVARFGEALPARRAIRTV